MVSSKAKRVVGKRLRGPRWLVFQGHRLLTTLVLLGSLALAYGGPTPAYAANRTVTTTADSGPGSLRQAIADAEAGDTISVAVSGLITLTSGELVINKNLTISGLGSSLLTISGNSTSRVFQVTSGTVNIRRMTISGGSAGDGGAIHNQGNLTLSELSLSSNSASNRGGAIYSSGTLVVESSSISNNFASSGGGGVYTEEGVTNISASTISNNTVSSCTTSLGERFGGGVMNVSNGRTLIRNSTISGNCVADDGAGIYNNNSNIPGSTNLVLLENVTISNNHALSEAGGIDNFGRVDLKNTILGGNTAGSSAPDCRNVFGHPFNSYGYNLIGNTAGCSITSTANPGTNITGVSPNLGPLQNNGGLTATRMPNPSSPAINTGSCTDIGGATVDNDQRGASRPMGGACDIGAVEFGPLVTNTNDSGPGSLRQVIADAAPGDTIMLAVSGLITLTSGELLINKNLTISGPGAAQLSISGNNASRVFNVTSGTVTISRLTIMNGRSGTGGAIRNAGTLTLSAVSVVSSSALPAPIDRNGGGIYNDGTLTLLGSTVSGNTADYGAGLYNNGSLTVADSTISGNNAAVFGAGLQNWGTASFTNSTISGNTSVVFGAGINISGGSVSLSFSTVTANQATDSASSAGGIKLFGGSAQLRASIVAGNNAASSPDVAGSVTSHGHNVIGSTSGSSGWVASDLQNVAPALGPLARNGGATRTHALLAGSPARNSVPLASCSGVAADQRGIPRPQGSACDSGSFEADPLSMVVTHTGDSGAGSLRQAILDANSTPDASIISFAIPGSGPHRIALSSGLPIITAPVTIDGWSQGGSSYTGPPLIEIDGSATSGASGLKIEAANTIIRGLAIYGFPAGGSSSGIGIGIAGGADNIWIYGNYIGFGTTAEALAAAGNGQAGIWIGAGSTSNTIGTNADGLNDAAERNVISRNGSGALGDGILIQGSANTVAGNYIGTTSAGTADLGNLSSGVKISAGGSNNIIGGTQPAQRNIMSGNDSQGVLIIGSTSRDNQVLGNYIGTNAAGTGALANAGDGIVITAGAQHNTIGGTAAGAHNVISGNRIAGVAIGRTGPCAGAASNNRVIGNYIGTNASATAAVPNSFEGVIVNDCSTFNAIGGSLAGEGNIISGNSFSGVALVNASNNTVQGNFIGLAPDGSTPLPNGVGVGIDRTSGLTAQANIIGGTTAAARNVISANAGSGVHIRNGAEETQVLGNYIGTDVSGTQDRGNGAHGIHVENAAGTRIGGTTAGARNVISGNAVHGIELAGSGTRNTLVQGNYLGTTKDANVALGNDGDGVGIVGAGQNTIGGTSSGARNIISANGYHGIGMQGPGADSNVVQGNYIGTDLTGQLDLGNQLAGISLDGASNNTLGGTTAGAGNLISGNQGHGVHITQSGATGNQVVVNSIGWNAAGDAGLGNQGAGVRSEATAGTGNRISQNAIAFNGGLGIDLGPLGVTPNDAGDTDSGPNSLQNFPVLLLASRDGSNRVIEGTLQSQPSTSFTLELFASAACDPSGNGEGALFLGSTPVTTDGSGNASFIATVSAAVPLGHQITAIAIGPGGNSSEFSACQQLELPNDAWTRARPITLSESEPFVERGSANHYLYKDGQSKWYKFSIQPGSRVVVDLTNLPANYDLTLYADISQAHTRLSTPEDLLKLQAEQTSTTPPDEGGGESKPPNIGGAGSLPCTSGGTCSTPCTSGGTCSTPCTSGGTCSTPTGSPLDALIPDALTSDAFGAGDFLEQNFNPGIVQGDAQAFSNAQTRSLIAFSALEGRASEQIIARTWENEGNFYVRVRGRNGAASSGAPFRLQMTHLVGPCGNVSPVPSTVAPTILGEAGDYKTLVLTNLAHTAGSDAEIAALWELVNSPTFTERPEVKAKVVNVAAYDNPALNLHLPGDARVNQALAQALNNPDCPTVQNYLAATNKEIIERYRELNPQLQHIVLLGGDPAIPFFRYPDRAELDPERGYNVPVKDATASQASLRHNYVLGQDGYGARSELLVRDYTLPVPDLAVGRLVETAAEIKGVLEAYLATNGGIVTPSSPPLITGYDFVSDAAFEVETVLEAGTGKTATVLIQPGDQTPDDPSAWTADQVGELLLKQDHDLIFLAGHFSAESMLAADYKSSVRAEELVASPVDFTNALIFSLGCHSGYNTVDEHGVPQVTDVLDWAQAVARKRGLLVAGTGYQYGDKFLTEYSERLYTQFARELRPRAVGGPAVPVGVALMRAKQDYLAKTAAFSGIHLKAYLQATLFGLPMLSYNLIGHEVQPAEDSLISSTQQFTTRPGLTLNLHYADLTLNPVLTEKSVTLTDIADPNAPSDVTASYFVGSQGIVVEPLKPILPQDGGNVSVPGMLLRGVGFREGLYADVAGQLPLISQPATELAGIYTFFRSDIVYPVQPWRVNYFGALAEPQTGPTRLAVMPAQYISQAPDSDLTTRRTFSKMSFRLYYSDNFQSYAGNTPALAAAPAISVVAAGVNSDGSLSFSVRVMGDPSAGLQEVWVTYTGNNGTLYGKWQSLNLTPNPADSTLWEGTLAASDRGTTAPGDVRYVVQAANGVGLVALHTNAGHFFQPDLGTPRSDPVATTLALQAPASGKYAGLMNVNVRLTTTADEAPLAGQKVVLSLGSQRWVLVTGADGSASLLCTPFQAPGVYELRASFAESEAHRGASAVQAFTIDKQTTTLSLALSTQSPQYSDESEVIATLRDGHQRPLSQRSVLFTLSGNGQLHRVLTRTDPVGRARLGRLLLPPGSYTLGAFFARSDGSAGNEDVLSDDPLYLGSSAEGTLTLLHETATATYQGDLVIATGGTLRLAATVTSQNDGTPGDLTRAQVQFKLFNNLGQEVAQASAAVGADSAAQTTITAPASGVYRVETSVVGQFFQSALPASDLLAVYDPSGHVTGGGWFESPAGAYTANINLTGKASFGFVARYHDGTSLPTGQTEFQFRPANLNFHSTGYDWLTVSNGRAQFKGSGRVNGTAGYSFMITVIDHQVSGGTGADKFRIKIWNSQTGAVVYDNQSGAADGADPTTAIKGGSIVVHK